MTTDTTALQERLVQAMREEDGDVQHGPEAHPGYYEYATAVLPIIAAEVQAAKAEAWQEGVNFALPNAETTWYPQHNPYRTTEHEAGDQA